MGEIFNIDVGEESAGLRIDAFLSSNLKNITRSRIQKLIESGNVTMEGRAIPGKNYRLHGGDRLTVEIPEAETLDILPENIPLDIVYEDDHLLVVNKPAGMVVHPAAGNYTGTLVNAIMFHCGDRLSSINGIVRPGIVHRIDKDTSGLLVVAKSDEAHRGLAEQFAIHSIKRIYHAIVYNNIKEDEGRIEKNIGRNPKDRLKMAVVPPGEGRKAITNYRVLKRSGRFTYIECRLETGRTHQIRVHMAYSGHPLLGDPVYGPRKGMSGINGQALHAKELGFIHPVTGEYLEFDSELPPDFTMMLKKADLDKF